MGRQKNGWKEWEQLMRSFGDLEKLVQLVGGCIMVRVGKRTFIYSPSKTIHFTFSLHLHTHTTHITKNNNIIISFIPSI